VHPDLLVGTSAGAINAAYLAGHGMSPQSLQELLPAGSACALPTAPSSAFGVAAHALTPLIQQRLVSAVSHARPI
jgi:hypothetical protein